MSLFKQKLIELNLDKEQAEESPSLFKKKLREIETMDADVGSFAPNESAPVFSYPDAKREPSVIVPNESAPVFSYPDAKREKAPVMPSTSAPVFLYPDKKQEQVRAQKEPDFLMFTRDAMEAVKEKNTPKINNPNESIDRQNIDYLKLLDKDTIQKLDEGKPFFETQLQSQLASKNPINKSFGNNVQADPYAGMNKEQKEYAQLQKQLYDYFRSWWQRTDKKTRERLMSESKQSDKKSDDLFRYGIGGMNPVAQDIIQGIGYGMSAGATNLSPIQNVYGIQSREKDGILSPFQLSNMAGSVLPIGLAMKPASLGLKAALPKVFEAAGETGAKAAAKRIGLELSADTATGIGYGVTQETLDALKDTRKDGEQTLGERTQKVALDALFGLGIGLGIEGIGAASRAIRGYNTSRAERKAKNAELDRILGNADEIKYIQDALNQTELTLARLRRRKSQLDVAIDNKNTQTAKANVEKELEKYTVLQNTLVTIANDLNARSGSTVLQMADTSLADAQARTDLWDRRLATLARQEGREIDKVNRARGQERRSALEELPVRTDNALETIPTVPEQTIEQTSIPEQMVEQTNVPDTQSVDTPNANTSNADELYTQAVRSVRDFNRPTVEHLQKSINVTKKQAQQLLDRMEQDGYVVRDARNRRVVSTENIQNVLPEQSSNTDQSVPQTESLEQINESAPIESVSPPVSQTSNTDSQSTVLTQETVKPSESMSKEEFIAEIDRLLKKIETEPLTPEEQAFIDAETGATPFKKATAETYYIFTIKEGYVEREGIPVDIGYGIKAFIEYKAMESSKNKVNKTKKYYNKELRISEQQSGILVSYLKIEQGRVESNYLKAVNKAKLELIRIINSQENGLNLINTRIYEHIKKNGISPRFNEDGTIKPQPPKEKPAKEETPQMEPRELVEMLVNKKMSKTLTKEEQKVLDALIQANPYVPGKGTIETFYYKNKNDTEWRQIQTESIDLGHGVKGFIVKEMDGDNIRFNIFEATSGVGVGSHTVKAKDFIGENSRKEVNARQIVVNKAKMRFYDYVYLKDGFNRTRAKTYEEALQQINDLVQNAKNNIGPSPYTSSINATSGLPNKVDKNSDVDINAYFGGEAGDVAGILPVYSPTGRTISRSDVVRNIKKRFNIQIGTLLHKWLYRRALGLFMKKREVIRTKVADDMFVIAHELGHYLDKLFKLQDPAFEVELLNFWNTVSPGSSMSYKPDQYFEEAVAEFVRIYLIDPQYAKANAPGFFDYFESRMDKNTLKNLKDTHEDIKTWIAQGAFEQASGMIDYLRTKNTKRNIFKSLYIKTVDRLHAIATTQEEALRSVEREWIEIQANRPGLAILISNETSTIMELQRITSKRGRTKRERAILPALIEAVQFIRKRDAAKTAYRNARLTYGSQGKAESILNYGFLDKDGNFKSEGLQAILNDLETLGLNYDDLDKYATAVHALHLRDNMGKQIPFDDNQLTELLRLGEVNPELEGLRKRLVIYNQNLLYLLVEGGMLSKKKYEQLIEKYPEYVPFFRVMDKDYDFESGYGGKGASGGESFVNLSNPLKKMSEKGSTRDIISPLESIISQTHLYVSEMDKNLVGRQLIDLGNVEGIGKYIEVLTRGKDGYVYVQNKGQIRAERIVTVWVNGVKKQVMINDPELFDAFNGLNEAQSNMVLRMLNFFTRTLKIGATGTPEFVVRNPFRDFLTAFVIAGLPPIRAIKAIKSVLTKDESYQRFLFYGGRTSSDIRMNREASQDVLKQMSDESMKNQNKYTYAVRRLLGTGKTGKDFALHIAGMLTMVKPFWRALQGIHKFSEISDQVARLGIFEDTFKKTGDYKEAAFQARDIMDFNRAGQFGTEYNKVSAFFNASIQGTDAILRYAKKDPIGFFLRGTMYLTLPAMLFKLYNYSVMDDEARKEYEQIDRSTQDFFFIIYNPESRTFIRLPKPYGLNYIFCNPVERTFDRMYLDKKDAMTKDLWGSFSRNFVPPWMPTAFMPLVEYMSQYSFFKKYSVIPADEKNLQRKDQYGMQTSLTSRAIAQGMDKAGIPDDAPLIGGFKSPRLTDQFIYGYTAGAGKYATDIIDLGLKQTKMFEKDVEEPSKRFTELPLARAFFVNTAVTSTQARDFYDLYDKIYKAKNSATFNKTYGVRNPDGKTEFSRMSPEEQFKIVSIYKEAIDRYSAYSKYIQNNDKFNAQEKRKKLDDIRAKIDDLATEALKKVGK